MSRQTSVFVINCFQCNFKGLFTIHFVFCGSVEEEHFLCVSSLHVIDQVNFEQGATFLGRNSNYVYELGTSLEFTKIGGGCSGEVAIESYSPSTGAPCKF